MFKRLIKFSFLLTFIGAGILGANFRYFPDLTKPAAAATNLNGRILLQVEANGEAWYVNPVNSQRYYLGRPDDAYSIMRSLGLGVSNFDFYSFTAKAPARLAGRILLKVQDKGQAYYVDPIELKLYYLGRPADAFSIMKAKGLGISNVDLIKIQIAAASPINTSQTDATTSDRNNSFLRKFIFKYKNNNYDLTYLFFADLYNSYKNSPKVYTYTVGSAPVNARDEFYGLLLKLKNGDATLSEIIVKLKETAAINNWTDDELLEFTVALVQYIPYDDVKVINSSGLNNNPYFPYETLYLNKGVCSDKTFLAVAMLRQLGYGTAILDFPDHNHTALGVACPTDYSVNGSGYCYVEMTNYFPFGVIPQSISNGQAQTSDGFFDAFNSSSLGTIEIYQKTTGKIYQRIPFVYSQVATFRANKSELTALSLEIDSLNTALTAKEAAIVTIRSQMDAYYNNGQIREYNNLIPEFNSLVNEYNADLAVYQVKVGEYNAKVNEFNVAVKAFYQR